MIKPPSLQKEYTLIFSGDPALDLPEIPVLADNASDEAKKAHDDAVKERERVLKVARQTGNWPLKEGENPTLFHMEPLTGTARDFLDGENKRHGFGIGEMMSLVFRLAIRRIDNFGDLKVKVERREGFKIATVDVINQLRAHPGVGDEIVGELGGVVLNRTFEPVDPL